jgi:hypothetical protein
MIAEYEVPKGCAMSSEDYLRGIRRAQSIQGNGGDPNLIHGANAFEQAGIDAVSRNYKKNTFEGGDIVGAVGKSIDEYKELNEEDKTKTKVAMIVLVLVGLLFLSAM